MSVVDSRRRIRFLLGSLLAVFPALHLETPVTAADPPETTAEGPADHSSAAPPNRLISETSPYLLQHASNPMDWYPWGQEAFDRARAENKPIFLSVGYSTCYWCHVMERETFEDPRVADFMNAHFINVKVDREERPDVDDIYMTAVQVMTRQGGWPMSVFLTPDGLKPFYGGTYFPPETMGNRPGFLTLATSLSEAWSTQAPLIQQQADAVAETIMQQMADRPATVPVGREVADTAVSQLLASYDEADGGYGGAPKFPVPATLDLLLEAGWDLPRVRESVLHTLDRMAMGGIYDQVGGGFHRYSTDAQWLVPHFEKMLYDNGMLASTYARAFALTDDPLYGRITAQIADYVLREMTATGGAFFSAQDAESNAREGESYLWDEDEVRGVLNQAGLSSSDQDLVVEVYGLDRGTNFRDPHHPGDPPRNVLYFVDRPDRLAAARGLTMEGMMDGPLAEARRHLLDTRRTRDQPLTDDKIIVGWNGLMIAGLADAGRVLDEPRYVAAAERAAGWIRSRMWTPERGLMRTARDEDVKIEAFLEDYAMLVRGLVALSEATADPAWLAWAESLVEQARRDFWDEERGGWYDTRADQSDLLVRGRSLYDGAIPSGSGSMLLNLVRLRDLGQRRWDEDIRAALAAASWTIDRAPASTAASTRALVRLLRDHPELVAHDGVPEATVKAGRVTLTVSPASRSLPAGTTAKIMLRVTIEPGWHVGTPGQDNPFAIGMSVASLDPNLSVTGQWPPGRPFRGPEGELTVYEDTVLVPLTVTATGVVDDPPRIMVTWQACTDRICEAPRTQRIPLDLIPEETP